MLIKNKKADISLNTIAAVIMVVAFLSMVLLFYMVFQPKAEASSITDTCRYSVMARTATSFNPAGVDVKWGPLLCKTQDVKISGKREALKEQVARSMANCWYMFNEGRQDNTLGSANVWKLLGFASKENACFLCYTLMVDQSEIEDGPVSAPEMFRYLFDTDYNKIKGKKYIDYIQSYGGAGKVSVLSPIQPKEAYGVVFLAKNSEETTLGTSGKISAVVGGLAALGVVACIIFEPCGVLTAIGAGTVAVAAGGYAAVKSADIIAYKVGLYKIERDVSMVYFDDLKTIEASGCLIKDMAK